jgi:phosphate transport system permease protein
MRMVYRSLIDRAISALSLCAAFLSAGLLIVIIGTLFVGALPVLSLHFILTPESGTRIFDGAIGNAVAGTVLISLLATVLAVPFALGTAIYLAKYAPKNKYTAAIRFFIEVLSGTPSIVVGVFGFLLLVVYLKPFTGGYSLIAGSIGLAILIMPVIERAAEEAIIAISAELEEGSFALGATKWQTLQLVTLPAAVSGILTGIILGFGRSAEESAVVVFTAGYSQFIPQFAIKSNPGMFLGLKIYPFQDLVATLPVSVYNAYEHANIVPAGNAFATAFVLIVVVLAINIAAKMVCSGMTANAGGKQKKNLWLMFSFITKYFKKKMPKNATPYPDEELWTRAISGIPALPEDIRSPVPRSEKPDPLSFPGDDITLPAPPEVDPRKPSRLWEKIVSAGTLKTQGFRMFGQKIGSPASDNKDHHEELHKVTPVSNGKSRKLVRPFLRTFIPFAIPAALMLLVAFLATVPPLHTVLGPASPALAGLFSSGLTLVVTVAGLVFGLLFAKKSGTFRSKNRRTGYAAVAAGFCILCIAGIICSSAAAGLFRTGDEISVQTASDRNAKLAALIAAGDQGDGQGSAISVQTSHAAPPVVPTRMTPGAATPPAVPVKDALGVGESYWYGDSEHLCRATVYDYKVLPFYFWWWSDWSRFVMQQPPDGDMYLVVYLRIEDLGTKSAIIPAADQIEVTNNGNSYTNEPFFNMSLLSQAETDYYSNNLNTLPYEWIREIGQQKRDYSYLMGYNIFAANGGTSAGGTAGNIGELTSNTSSGSSSFAINQTEPSWGLGYFLHPGTSNAIDGYLIYAIPETAVNTTEDLKSTYVQISFNNISSTRWQLGTDVPPTESSRG